MENTVQITLAEYETLAGIKKDFDGKLKSAVEARIDSERAFVLRDRDEYIRRNELLFQEKSEAREEVRRVSEANVKLRLELGEVRENLGRIEKLHALARMRLDAAESELKRRDENEATLRETVNRLRGERREALLKLDGLHRRGLLSRILNRRP